MLESSEPNIKVAPSKFNASLSFSHRPPYEALFSERIPILQAFQCAMGNYLYERAQSTPSFLQKLGLLVNPLSHPFRAVECGVYTGSSLLACGLLAHESKIPFNIIGLDTFTGLPPLSDKDRSLAPEGSKYLKKEVFTDTSLESVQAKIDEAGLNKHIQLHKGLFKDTLPTLTDQQYHFVNIDCDLYEPHIECLEYFYLRMVKGGVMFFDDYHSVEYPMAGKAIDQFMIDKPEQLSHLRFGKDGANITKSFFVKY